MITEERPILLSTPYPGCVETLLPRAMYKTIYDCENTPDEGFPRYSDNSFGKFRKIPRRFKSDQDVFLALPRLAAELLLVILNLWGLILQVKNC